MAKKTVFRRLSKWLPLSAELREVVELDDEIIDIEAHPPTAPGGLAALIDGGDSDEGADAEAETSTKEAA